MKPRGMRRLSALLAALVMAAALIAPAGLPAVAGERQAGNRPAVTLREANPPAKAGKGHRAAADPKIVGGTAVPSGTYRFMAFLHISIGGSTYLCGGSLIDPSHILTAAHCAEGASAAGITAWIGGNQMSGSIPQGSLQRSASAVAVHPSYNGNTQQYDAAVITLSQAVPSAANGGIDPVTLVSSGSGAGLAQNTSLTVAGWGTTSSGGSMASQLMSVAVPVQSDQYCSGQYAGSGYSTSTMFCAGPQGGGKDSCQGDSGGPIFFDNGGVLTQVGVVSWGYGCAQAGYPGVYSRLANASISSFIGGILGNPVPPTPNPVSDTTAPSVRINNPARNGVVRSTFTVSVSASDAESGIRKVELQQCFGSQCSTIATDPSAPYSFRLTGSSGKAVIRAVATDGVGHTATTIKTPIWIR